MVRQKSSLILFFLLFALCTQLTASGTHWWNESVFYEIFVRSFKDSDGDGRGDFNGMTQQLDYLEELGINGIWLMPISESPSYHGYDVTDYRETEPDYGSLPEFKQFLDSAHARDIRVIVDLVVNHCSTQHPWFQGLSQGDTTYWNWFIHQPVNPAWIGPWGQQVWHALPGVGWYYAIFWGGMPDLNWDHPPVRQEVYDIAAYWLDSVGVDGFRLDAVKHLVEDGDTLSNAQRTHDALRDFYTFYKTGRPGVFTVGEAWDDTEVVSQYKPGEEIDICFDFELASDLISGINSRNAAPILSQMQEVMESYPFLQFGTFLTNHDQDRVFGQLGANETKAKLAAGLLLTLPGVPFIYYGEEIGMSGAGADENKRRPMQWSGGAGGGFTNGNPWYNLSPDFATRNVALQQNDSTSLWHFYRKMIQLRRSRPALQVGTYQALSSSAGEVLAFIREDSLESLIVVANLGSNPLAQVSLSLDSSRFGSGTFPVQDLLSNASATDLTTDAQGGFANYVPFSQLEARSLYVLAINGTVGRETSRSDLAFSLWPNPVTDQFKIQNQSNKLSWKYQLRDNRGRLLIMDTVHTQTSEIRINDLAEGIYFLEITQGEKRYIKKIIKRK